MIVNSDLRGMWKEVVMDYCKVLSWYLTGWTKENRIKPVGIISLLSPRCVATDISDSFYSNYKLMVMRR